MIVYIGVVPTCIGYVIYFNVINIIKDFFFQAEDGIRDLYVTGVQTCALPIWGVPRHPPRPRGRLPGGQRRDHGGRPRTGREHAGLAGALGRPPDRRGRARRAPVGPGWAAREIGRASCSESVYGWVVEWGVLAR